MLAGGRPARGALMAASCAEGSPGLEYSSRDSPRRPAATERPDRWAAGPNTRVLMSRPTPSGDPPVKTKATIQVPGLKVALPMTADALPRDLVPMEGPAGEPTI